MQDLLLASGQTTGLHVHRSERADALVVALGDLLATPSGDPFEAEVVAVPSRGIERWLAQRLSHVLGAVDGDGVCANVDFPSMAKTLDDAIAAADEAFAASVERWSPERAVWPLLAIVDDSVRTQGWAAVLAAHLGLDGVDRGRRFAVGSKLARLYSSYEAARPAMLREWAAGRDTELPSDLAWQAQLWRRLRAELGPSPAQLLDAACARLQTYPDTVPLPDRFSIFGATRIAPARLAVLRAVAANRDVHLWLHHPSPALWDAVRAVAPRPGRRRDDAGRQVVHNPLLASLSRDIRELQQLLPADVTEDVHHAVGERPPTLLGRLQTVLAADAAPEPLPIVADDHSLQVHACHGAARQVEVIRESVLQLLRADPTLEPRDVLIMCPDVETFAPLVAAAFGMADEPGGHPAARLRVRLADRSLRQTNPLLGLLSQLLELAANRVTATQVLDLAGAAAVRRMFSFTDDDVEQLRAWASAANARWGLDAPHRVPYGLGAVEQGTWRSALDRLLLGIAMEEDDRWIGAVLPLDDVDSGAIDLAGRFAEFVDRIDAVVRLLEQRHTVGEWAELLGDAVLALGAPLHAWHALQLREELDDIAEHAGAAEVELTRADIAGVLAGRLAGRPTRASFRTGTLTVCTLVPMRSVPHRVVCLVGMDDGAFPRHGVVDGDDILARDPHTGERDVRSEDRQLFLDAICAAQEHLLITYTGADPRSGAEVPPCVPLGELLDALDALTGGSARDRVVVRHPLQPFDDRNFAPGGLGVDGPFSFDPAALTAARATRGGRVAKPPLVPRPLDHAEAGDVELDDLIKFLQHPARGFLRQRLQISLWDNDDEPADALSVSLDGLQSWALGERILRNRVGGMSSETCREIEHRRGDLPPGQLGRRMLRDVGTSVDALLAACADVREQPTRPVDVAVAVAEGRRLVGTVVVRGDAILSVTYSRLGPKHRIEAWVRYLALVAATGDSRWQAVSVGRRGGDGVRRAELSGMDPADALGVLTELVELRDAGLHEPVPLVIKTSAAYAERLYRGQDEADAADAARRCWESGNYPGEDAENEHLLVFGRTLTFTELATAAFVSLAQRVWDPLLSVEVDAPT